jgi:hypothetical protein
MKKLTKEQQRFLVKLWDKTGPELERIRREELANMPYDWRVVDSLLAIGDMMPRKEEEPNGLVEMQKAFMEIARKQGLMPAMVREAPAPYGKSAARTAKSVRGDSKRRSSCGKTPKRRSKGNASEAVK